MADKNDNKDGGEQVTTIKPDNNSGNNSQDLENLQKQLTDAQKKIEEQAGELKGNSEYVQQAQAVAMALRANPELEGMVQDQVRKFYNAGDNTGNQTQQKNQEQDKGKSDPMESDAYKALDAKVSKTEKAQRSSIIRSFEDKHGISNLSTERQKEVRQKIMEQMSVYGVTASEIPIENLEAVMESSFSSINNEQIVNEGAAAAYTNNSGAFGGVSGRNTSADDDKKGLTDAQTEWAKKMQLDPKKVQEAQERDDATFVPSAEKPDK